MKRSEAIKNLLTSRTVPDLAALYSADMEVQINVAQGNGERTDRDYKGRKYQSYSDGIEHWGHFRIPHNAKIAPEDNDHELSFNLAEHVEGIGMTGWDWRNKKSKWVAFDFDAIAGHSEKHSKKLTDAQLQLIKNTVSTIPWVTIRLSTSGQGLHLYVFLEDVTTDNHTEHAAVARSILGLMSSITGIDLQASVDNCGGNMWCWHRKMAGTNGLTLLKQGTPLKEIPVNWRDHLNVITSRSKKIVPSFIAASEVSGIDKMFEELTSSRTKIPLDSVHQQLIQYLHETHAQAWWDADNHCLVTHTIHLKEAHEHLKLKGIFKTISQGRERGNDHNLFMSPIHNGAWVVRRFTPGVAEDVTWSVDNKGFTKCYFNMEPDLQTAARSKNAIENTSGAFVFREANVAVTTAQQLGVKVELPSWITNREASLKHHRDGRLIIQIKHEANDPANEMPGWLAGKGMWTKIFAVQIAKKAEPEVGNYDQVIRHLTTPENADCGWMIKTDGEWFTEPLTHARALLKALGMKGTESDVVVGSSVAKPWRLICKPFEPEEPGGRIWNRNAPQLAFIPTASDLLTYPHWLMILQHLGQGLDDAIKVNEWCKTSGILTGADYLKCWLASIFQEPRQPLPYLFFYSDEQNTGKSIFHEAVSLLVTKGVVRADNALTNQQGFNAELENAILCVIEEVDMQKNKVAYSRIKDWTTGLQIPIHKKTLTPYSVDNTTHYCQMANTSKACPVGIGDSRIVVIEVKPIDPSVMIPKKQLIELLEKEAPDFLAALLHLELPKSNDRLNIPVVSTDAKKVAEKSNQTYLDIFLEEVCHYAPGQTVLYADFYERFKEWVDVDQLGIWTKIRVGRELPKPYVKGRLQKNNQIYVGNVSFDGPSEANGTTELILQGEHLVPKGVV